MRAYQPKQRGFTLIELLASITILITLAALLSPTLERFIERSRSTVCAGNLRQIGVAVSLYTQDHNGSFPFINNPERPVYTTPEELPDGQVAQTMMEAFSPYGLTERTFRCPSDVAKNNYFAKEATSYEWRPWVDGENFLAPKVFTRRGAIALRSASRVRIVMDTDSVHSGRQNTLYADGRVQAY